MTTWSLDEKERENFPAQFRFFVFEGLFLRQLSAAEIEVLGKTDFFSSDEEDSALHSYFEKPAPLQKAHVNVF